MTITVLLMSILTGQNHTVVAEYDTPQARRCPLSAKSGHWLGYSMTSSARPMSVFGMLMPSALAVLRLMVSSTLVTC